MSFRFSIFDFRFSNRRAAPSPRHRAGPRLRRAFSLVEVLLAIFILGIGLIMVASVFPVGANWTRQTTEDSVGQTIAQNALTVIKTHYGPGGNLQGGFFSDFVTPGGLPNPANVNSVLKNPVSPFYLQALPLFNNIPANERAYQFGSSNPFPATNPAACTYFWTALIRLDPFYNNPDPTFNVTNHIQPASSYKYDLYILVFRKGAAEHTFTANPPGATEVLNTRDFGSGPTLLLPSVVYAPYVTGSYDASKTPAVQGAVPSIGQLGIGVTTGTVFRQLVNTSFTGAYANPPIRFNPEQVIYSPPADGTATTASPLIYIYQTSLTF